MRKSNSKLANVLRAMDAFTVPAQPVERTPQMTGECSYGLHKHCPKATHYVVGNSGNGYLSATEVYLPCECACHQDAVTCHRCGAPVESDALAVQTAADGTPKMGRWYCRAHAVAGATGLRAAIERERERREREQREGGK